MAKVSQYSAPGVSFRQNFSVISTKCYTISTKKYSYFDKTLIVSRLRWWAKKKPSHVQRLSSQMHPRARKWEKLGRGMPV